MRSAAGASIEEERSTWSWTRSAARIAFASASHRRVEPSILPVKTNVTTPEGAAAGSADTHAETHTDTRLPRTSTDPARSPDTRVVDAKLRDSRSLCSADWAACVSRAPHLLQNFAVGLDCAPQETQTGPVAVNPPTPSPLGSTSVSFHCWSVMSVRSPCHLRHEVLRPSFVVAFETRSDARRVIAASDAPGGPSVVALGGHAGPV